jgi:enoyl-CoA hydratase/carnithine racemase
MRAYKSLLIDKKGHIGYVFFNNPDTDNRIGRAESLEMTAAFKEIDEDKDIRVVILSGKNNSFCTGGKIDGFPDGLIVDQRAYSVAMVDAVLAIFRLSKPIIAAVNANAVAGGLMFVQCCDLAIAGRDCLFGLPEIQRGYFPMIALAVLQKLMPKKRLLEMAFTGDLVSAETMLEWNLLNKIVDTNAVLGEAEKLAERIVSYNTMSTLFGRSCYYAMENMNLTSSLEHARGELLNMLWTHDSRETAYAAEEGRPPEYQGN